MVKDFCNTLFGNLILIFRTEQKIRYVHGLNALIVSACKFICPEYIFGVVVMYFKQTVVFPFFRFFRMNLLCNLHIQLIVLSRCYKVDFSVVCFADMNGVSSASKPQIHNIFKTCSNAVSVITENAVSHGVIRKVKLLLCFQDFLAL